MFSFSSIWFVSGANILFLASINSFDSFNRQFDLFVNSSKFDKSFKIGSLFAADDSFPWAGKLFCSIESDFSISFNTISFVFSLLEIELIW